MQISPHDRIAWIATIIAGIEANSDPDAKGDVWGSVTDIIDRATRFVDTLIEQAEVREIAQTELIAATMREAGADHRAALLAHIDACPIDFSMLLATNVAWMARLHELAWAVSP